MKASTAGHLLRADHAQWETEAVAAHPQQELQLYRQTVQAAVLD